MSVLAHAAPEGCLSRAGRCAAESAEAAEGRALFGPRQALDDVYLLEIIKRLIYMIVSINYLSTGNKPQGML